MNGLIRYERNYLAVLRCFTILSFGNSGQMIVIVYRVFVFSMTAKAPRDFVSAAP